MPVQMSKEEEELVRELLWTLVNNHVFFQHPDLIRILKIHENVIAIMMNSIARSEGGGGGGGEGEVIVSKILQRFLLFPHKGRQWVGVWRASGN